MHQVSELWPTGASKITARPESPLKLRERELVSSNVGSIHKSVMDTAIEL